MQLTANLAVLATVVAASAPSVFALPLNVASNSVEAREYELDLEAREIAEFEARELQDLELAARDLIDEYYEAREVYDELDARSFDEDLESREFYDYLLDARDASKAATPAAPAPTSTSAASTSPSATASPSATGAATPAGSAPSPSATSTGGNGDVPVHHAHAHMPSVLIHALTDEHHLKLKHYAEIQLHIFNTLVDLTDGEPNQNGVKESAEVEKLAKEILGLKRWHRHHLHHGHHVHKDGSHPHEPHSAHTDSAKEGDKPAHEKHDGAKDATPASPSGTPSATGSAHHAHHDLYHAKIHELKIGSHKADRYIARARLHKDRLHLIALGPNGEHDEAYEAAVKHEKQWLERHLKKAHHLHHASDPSATSAAGSPKADKPAEATGPKTAQGVKRRALRRRGFF